MRYHHSCLNHIQQTQACFANIDQIAIETLAVKGEGIRSAIRFLCSQDRPEPVYTKGLGLLFKK